MSFKKVLILLVLILTAVLVIQNTHAVTLRLLFWEITMSRILLYPVLIIIGFIAGWIFAATKKKIN